MLNMSLVIAPVSYKRLLTTISQQFQVQPAVNPSWNQQAAMKDIFSTIDADTFLIDHTYVSKKTNFLDILDEDTLLQLAYEFELDKKAELPELKDIEILIDNCSRNINENIEKAPEKMIQR